MLYVTWSHSFRASRSPRTVTCSSTGSNSASLPTPTTKRFPGREDGSKCASRSYVEKHAAPSLPCARAQFSRAVAPASAGSSGGGVWRRQAAPQLVAGSGPVAAVANAPAHSRTHVRTHDRTHNCTDSRAHNKQTHNRTHSCTYGCTRSQVHNRARNRTHSRAHNRTLDSNSHHPRVELRARGSSGAG